MNVAVLGFGCVLLNDNVVNLFSQLFRKFWGILKENPKPNPVVAATQDCPSKIFRTHFLLVVHYIICYDKNIQGFAVRWHLPSLKISVGCPLVTFAHCP